MKAILLVFILMSSVAASGQVSHFSLNCESKTGNMKIEGLALGSSPHFRLTVKTCSENECGNHILFSRFDSIHGETDSNGLLSVISAPKEFLFTLTGVWLRQGKYKAIQINSYPKSFENQDSAHTTFLASVSLYGEHHSDTSDISMLCTIP